MDRLHILVCNAYFVLERLPGYSIEWKAPKAASMCVKDIYMSVIYCISDSDGTSIETL